MKYPVLAIFLVVIFGQFTTGAPIPEIELSMELSNTRENQVILSTEHDSSISEYQLSSIELPSIEPPSIEIPSIELPSFEFPSFKFEDVNIVLIVIGIIGILVILWFTIPAIITAIIHAIGFGVTGIAKGSYAAALMASYSGHVFVRSLCAILQSVGVLGISGFKGLFILIGKLLMLFLRTIFCCCL
ncbi:1338_t:CDS:1 [Acaulospora morrowiae]|uniref:1338_t:CDS:1 n=1 Tax=Acaulospora morrowiae TaxID=94023 RepID=A0A9N8VTS7_9GLOM|nr:1338_t:CDS:1 [Acaulospora morrowiae]